MHISYAAINKCPEEGHLPPKKHALRRQILKSVNFLYISLLVVLIIVFARLQPRLQSKKVQSNQVWCYTGSNNAQPK